MRIRQSPMLDPLGFSPLVEALPNDVPALVAVVQGLLVHTDWLSDYGLDLPYARGTLPVSDRLAEILGMSRDPLDVARPPRLRAVGTCRDYALMLAAMLRIKGIEARLRCGFASYFRDGWEDHWICEYRQHPSGAWIGADAQLDATMRAKLEIGFDPACLPPGRFMTAGQAWLAWRDGSVDAGRFGHGAATGPWFIKVNVIRDHHAVTDRIVSAWDRWREAPEVRRTVRSEQMDAIDRLAQHPDREPQDLEPDWLAASGAAGADVDGGHDNADQARLNCP